MFKKTLLTMVLAATSFSSFANWSGGLSIIDISDDELDFGVIAASAGYTFKVTEQFSVMPELRLGQGIENDSVEVFSTDVKLEIKSFTSVSVRGQYEFNDNWYGFAAPSYTNLDVKASALGQSGSDDEWELGINAGLGYKINDVMSLEASLERFDGTDFIGAGFKVNF